MAGLGGRSWLLPAVLGLHLLLLQQVADNRMGWGKGERAPVRIEVAFVRELAPTTPPAATPAAPPVAAKRLPAVAAQADRAASAPRAAARAASAEPREETAATGLTANNAATQTPEPTAPMLPDPPMAAAREPAASPAAANADSLTAPPSEPAIAALPAAEPASAAIAQPPVLAVAPTAPHFNWPPSTRLSYKLTGDYQGPVHGSARVDWLRQGTRYQVRLESSAGPLFSRQVVSEGDLTDAGLHPRRFHGEQKVLFASTRRWSLQFGPERVTLADGREVERLAGAQDEASQFVHLTWLFTMHPERLQVGRSIDFPLALNRKLERWTFDVVAQEALALPCGTVDAFHVKPRREASGGDMTAEMWFAPALQYLPVRIMIRQRQQHWVDLQLEKPPLQAAEAGPARP